jgi:malonyl-CoA/methylmalonyl-CoA synthetase
MQPGKPRPEEREFLRILKKDLAGFKVPKLVFFVDEMPRNAMGKIQKAALRARYSEAFYAKPT